MFRIHLGVIFVGKMSVFHVPDAFVLVTVVAVWGRLIRGVASRQNSREGMIIFMKQIKEKTRPLIF